MQLIKPRLISGEIMTLIEEAEEKVVIVSPYYKISKWYKLLNCFEEVRSRNIDVEFYVRENENDSIQELLNIGVTPICIPNLHTKLYLNEKYGIVSSMNMLLSSDTNSLDIALKTQTTEEYLDLSGYYTRYIKGCTSFHDQPFGHYNWIEELDKNLTATLGRQPYITEQDGKLTIKVSGKYEAFISNERKNKFRISGILSHKEFQFATSNNNIFQSSNMTLEFIAGTSRYYDCIWGTMEDFKSRSINDLINGEERIISEAIVKFISGVEQLKKMIANRARM